ncbi:nucleotidyltransferase family protein [Ancylobacter polymorphus]|uniref:Nucleotidyltransferase family protein n=1 Tax=Ancylobacter polymorphus TaxID=223390 RepID=A0A9E7A910_9HYPH|nr:nucleotidyltransferase family protein [Ancylobacter polymorphus]UOK71943.1 nucleotidyltransferase family protein [Ancylobacter polymorphus]
MPRRNASLDGLRLLCALVSPFSSRAALRTAAAADAPWTAVLAQADRHRLIPALSVALARHGLGDRVDAELADILAAVADWNTERNEGLRRQMRAVSAALNAAGIAPVWLKGALTLLPPAGPAAGRQMSDLDLWLPEAAAQRTAGAVLRGLGYDAEGHEWKEGAHYPPYFHPDEMARIELHRTVLDPDQSALLPPEEAAQAVEWLDWDGLRIGRLDPLGRLLNAFAQCTRPQDHLLRVSTVPLMKALEFVVRIHDDFGGTLPPAFVERAVAAGWERPAQRLLTVTERYFGLPSPLPADPAQLEMLERFTRHPRWHYTRRALRTAVGAEGWGLWREPWRIPGIVAGYLARMAPLGR